MKTHRVGSYTFGGMLIIAGTLMLIRIFIPQLSYDIISRCWPVVFISLGIEILVANFRSTKIKFVYDAPAIFLMLVIVVFTIGMACAEFSIHHYLS
ncbi:DUF5668 domain-containing protein [Blautia schinkii]|nr:DUF5668 domain-containing protein [Blautia schinkii]